MVFVVARGSIERGAAERVREILRRHPGRDVALVISSGGGLLREAVEMAGIVERFRIPVLVPSGATCASACFFVLAASPTKTVDRAARAGIHSVSLEGEGGLSTLGVTALTGRLADECGVPPVIIGRMVAPPPSCDGAWLGPEELRAMRVQLADLPSIPPPGAAARPEPSPRRAPPSSVPDPPVVLSEPRPIPPAAPRRETPAQSVAPAAGEVPPGRIAGEPRAFADGLRDRTAWEAWIRTLPPSALAGAIFWAGQRSLPAPPGCGGMDAVFRQACEETRVRLAPTGRRRPSEPECRRGWNAFRHPACRDGVLATMRACRTMGGWTRLNRGFEQVRDLNGDGIEDSVLDFEALVCAVGALSACPSGACRLEIRLSRPDGHRRAFSALVRGRHLEIGPTVLLEVRPGVCPGRGGCREVWRVDGGQDAADPALRWAWPMISSAAPVVSCGSCVPSPRRRHGAFGPRRRGSADRSGRSDRGGPPPARSVRAGGRHAESGAAAVFR
jgi:hypothetical protein